MGLPTVDFRLRAGKADVLPVLRQLDAHLLADLFEDLRDPLDLGGIGIANREHRVFVPLLGADRHRAAVRSCPDHFQRQIRIMAVDADENTGFDLVAPDGEIGMVGIDHFFRIDLGVLRPVIRHGNDHDFRNLRRNFQGGLGFFHRMVVPGQSSKGPGKIVAFGLVNILRAISSMTFSSFGSSSP